MTTYGSLSFSFISCENFCCCIFSGGPWFPCGSMADFYGRHWRIKIFSLLWWYGNIFGHCQIDNEKLLTIKQNLDYELDYLFQSQLFFGSKKKWGKNFLIISLTKFLQLHNKLFAFSSWYLKTAITLSGHVLKSSTSEWVYRRLCLLTALYFNWNSVWLKAGGSTQLQFNIALLGEQLTKCILYCIITTSSRKVWWTKCCLLNLDLFKYIVVSWFIPVVGLLPLPPAQLMHILALTPDVWATFPHWFLIKWDVLCNWGYIMYFHNGLGIQSCVIISCFWFEFKHFSLQRLNMTFDLTSWQTSLNNFAK